MPACRPAGHFENKTSTAPKMGLGLGAELGKNQKIKIFKNESYQFKLVNPKILLRPHLDPKDISIGPQKAQNELKKQKKSDKLGLSSAKLSTNFGKCCFKHWMINWDVCHFMNIELDYG